ncbi:MAG: pyridoxal-phosphate-dependent aminotransferase family protein [Thermoleophilaceae bacterium]
MADPYIKDYLMTAGPTPLPPLVSQVMAEPMLYHRAPAFVEVYARVLERLRMPFETSNDVLCFTSSGSGGMESAAANMVRPGEPVLVASCGKFGQRWAELADSFGAETEHYEAEWGTKVDPAEVDRRLGEGGAKVFFTTLSETSTGVVNDIAALTDVAHRHGALIVVDAVSALGAIPVKQDELGVDVVVSGSQKALMAPPGLGFASVNEAALERASENAGQGRYYFDWAKTAKGQRKDPPDTAFTPAVGLFTALDVALGMIESEGLEAVFERHRLLGRATREAVKGLDLEIFGPEDEGANVVTAIRLPEGIDGGKVPKIMRDEYRITIAGGQNQLKGKIARIAHCGYFGAFDIITTVAALEMTLRDLGHDLELGAGVAAAQRVFLEAGVAAATPA